MLFLVRWLTLSSSKILTHECFIKRTIDHRMLLDSFLSKIWHHVLNSRLRHTFSPLFRNLVHLIEIFLGRRIQLDSEAFLRLVHDRSRLRFRNFIVFKTVGHCLVHDTLASRWDLLERVDLHVVQVTSAVQVSLLVAHDLFEEDVTTGFSLLLLEQEVVGWGNLIVFVVLNVCYSLV